MTAYKENKEFRILSAIGIILVVAGHLGFNVFDVGGLFPYYSFHVFIFLFVSGYFYKKEAEENVFNYILGKCKTLLLPYFVWNFLYGILTVVLHYTGFSIGQKLSLYTLFLAPFEGGHQFMYNFPAWFVPVLFLIEVINVCARKILSLLRLKYEWLIFTSCLFMGIVTVWLAIRGSVWGWYKIPGRILFMLPGFQMGCIYREKLEKYDTLPNIIYFPVVMGIQLLVTIFCGGLAFSAVWVTSFANGPIIPYCTVVTGIAFWFRVAKNLKKMEPLADMLAALGRNTYAVMMHHILSFFLMNGLFYFGYRMTSLCEEFDTELFFSDVNYVYPAGGAEAGKWLYLVIGIALPLLMAAGQKKIKNSVAKWIDTKKKL